tara:strand:- start:263 stop:460 length:198 start_codon:yes stop_codon:yes gene_type:complete
MKNLTKIFFDFFSKKKTSEILLGRWGLHKCTNKENIKVFWSNSDHCGDKLCGDVLKNKEILNNNK